MINNIVALTEILCVWLVFTGTFILACQNRRTQIMSLFLYLVLCVIPFFIHKIILRKANITGIAKYNYYVEKLIILSSPIILLMVCFLALIVIVIIALSPVRSLLVFPLSQLSFESVAFLLLSIYYLISAGLAVYIARFKCDIQEVEAVKKEWFSNKAVSAMKYSFILCTGILLQHMDAVKYAPIKKEYLLLGILFMIISTGLTIRRQRKIASKKNHYIVKNILVVFAHVAIYVSVLRCLNTFKGFNIVSCIMLCSIVFGYQYICSCRLDEIFSEK